LAGSADPAVPADEFTSLATTAEKMPAAASVPAAPSDEFTPLATPTLSWKKILQVRASRERGRGDNIDSSGARETAWAWGDMDPKDVLEETASQHLCACGMRSDCTQEEVGTLLDAMGAREAEGLPPESRLCDGDGVRRARNAFVLSTGAMRPVFSVRVKAGIERAQAAALLGA